MNFRLFRRDKIIDAMLTIDNNDIVAIEEFGAPDELYFWDVARVLCAEEMFPWLDEDETTEVNLLIGDYRRLNNQAEELMRVVPKYSEKVGKQSERLISIVEKQIAKIARHNVHYRQKI